MNKLFLPVETTLHFFEYDSVKRTQKGDKKLTAQITLEAAEGKNCLIYSATLDGVPGKLYEYYPDGEFSRDRYSMLVPAEKGPAFEDGASAFCALANKLTARSEAGTLSAKPLRSFGKNGVRGTAYVFTADANNAVKYGDIPESSDKNLHISALSAVASLHGVLNDVKLLHDCGVSVYDFILDADVLFADGDFTKPVLCIPYDRLAARPFEVYPEITDTGRSGIYPDLCDRRFDGRSDIFIITYEFLAKLGDVIGTKLNPLSPDAFRKALSARLPLSIIFYIGGFEQKLSAVFERALAIKKSDRYNCIEELISDVNELRAVFLPGRKKKLRINEYISKEEYFAELPKDYSQENYSKENRFLFDKLPLYGFGCDKIDIAVIGDTPASLDFVSKALAYAKLCGKVADITVFCKYPELAKLHFENSYSELAGYIVGRPHLGTVDFALCGSFSEKGSGQNKKSAVGITDLKNFAYFYIDAEDDAVSFAAAKAVFSAAPEGIRVAAVVRGDGEVPAGVVPVYTNHTFEFCDDPGVLGFYNKLRMADCDNLTEAKLMTLQDKLDLLNAAYAEAVCLKYINAARSGNDAASVAMIHYYTILVKLARHIAPAAEDEILGRVKLSAAHSVDITEYDGTAPTSSAGGIDELNGRFKTFSENCRKNLKKSYNDIQQKATASNPSFFSNLSAEVTKNYCLFQFRNNYLLSKAFEVYYANYEDIIGFSHTAADKHDDCLQKLKEAFKASHTVLYTEHAFEERIPLLEKYAGPFVDFLKIRHPYEGYKRLLEKSDFVFGYKPDISLTVLLATGDKSTMFANIAPALCLNPSKLTFISVSKDNEELAEVCKTYKFIKRIIENHSVSAELEICHYALGKDSSYDKNAMAKLKGVTDKLSFNRYDDFFGGIGALVAGYKADNSTYTLLSQSSVCNILLGALAFEGKKTISFNCSDMSFSGDDAAFLNAVPKKKIHLTSDDIFSRKTQQKDTAEDLFGDILKLYTIFENKQPVWKILSPILENYHRRNDSIVTFYPYEPKQPETPKPVKTEEAAKPVAPAVSEDGEQKPEEGTKPEEGVKTAAEAVTENAEKVEAPAETAAPEKPVDETETKPAEEKPQTENVQPKPAAAEKPHQKYQTYSFIIPSDTEEVFEKLLEKLKLHRYVRADSSYIEARTETTKLLVVTTANTSVCRGIDTLIDNAFKLNEPGKISVEISKNKAGEDDGKWISVRYDNLIVNGLSLLCDGENNLSQSALKYRVSFFEYLEKEGYIRNLRVNGSGVSYAYASPNIKSVFLTSGRMLELYVYYTLCAFGEVDELVFDCTVAWDNNKTVTNEFDCVAIKGFKTLFIECKSVPKLEQDYYYKLSVLVREFGINARSLIVADIQNSVYNAVNVPQINRGSLIDVETLASIPDVRVFRKKISEYLK